IAVERVQIDRMVHVASEAADDIRGGVVWEHRRPRRGAGDGEDGIHSLNDEAVTNAQPLVRRPNGEMGSTPRIALLIVVEAFEAKVEHRVRLRFLATVDRGAAAGASRE